MAEGVEWFQFHVNPEPWAVGPIVIGRRNGRPTGNMGRNVQLDAYKQAIREEFDQRYAPMVAQYPPYYSLDFFFYRRQDAYLTQAERRHRKHEADATNLSKSTEDALQGYLYENDRDVKRVCSWVVEQGPDVEHPGVVVRFRYGIPKDEILTLVPVPILDELRSYRHLQVVPEPIIDNNNWPPKDMSDD
jgi:Endodeoxyribonuclease RusA